MPRGGAGHTVSRTMTRPRSPASHPLRVLVAGGGVGAIESVLALHALAGDRVTIEMLAPGDDFVERPSSVLSPFSGESAPRVPLGRLSELGVVRRHGALGSVDSERHEVRTRDGVRIGYDRLIVATGARSVEAVPGATTFRGPLSAGAVEGALRRARERVLFTVPAGAGWTLPLYELALLAAHELPDGPELTIVTPEPRPLDLFGPVASDALARLLDRAGIGFEGETVAEAVVGGALSTRDGRLIVADEVIALARLQGPRIAGLPADAEGFIGVDEHGRVTGTCDVFAAGDATSGAVKQGGLAAQQADAAAETIAAEAGAHLTPRACRRVLRGVVFTGEAPLYLRRDLDDDSPLARPLRGAPVGISRSQLWWPSGKIGGRYLTGFLAAGGEPGDTLSDRPRRPVLAHPTTEGPTMSSILIGVDASARSEDAIAFGRRLADASSARVVVACAFAYSDAPSRASNTSYRQDLADDAKQTARDMRDRLEGIAADRLRITVTPNPSPAHALHDLAEAEHAEIIVVGSSHTGRLGRVTPGSTGERLLHGAPCAVAVVPHGYRTRAHQSIRRIGVAYDGSDEADAAVTAAVDLSRALDAELEIIGVVAPQAYSATALMGGLSSATLLEDIERSIQAGLDTVVAGLPADITGESVRLAGDPADQLGEHSAGLDLMLAGSRGYGPLRSVLVGGVSGRLMRTVQCPVIVVPRGVQEPLGALFATETATAA